MKTREKKIEKKIYNDTLSFDPVAHSNATQDVQKELLDLQLKMATCSINHEYARMEFETAADFGRKDQLLDFMHECRCQYFDAREELSAHDPYALADFEKDLMRQKQVTFGGLEA